MLQRLQPNVAERFHARGHLHRVLIAVRQLAFGQHRLIGQQLQRLLLCARGDGFQRRPRRGRVTLQLLRFPCRLSFGQHRAAGCEAEQSGLFLARRGGSKRHPRGA